MAEHDAVELQVLLGLEAASPNIPEFAGRAKVFAKFVKHHAEEEGKTMFAMTRKLFSVEERAELDDQYTRWQDSPQMSKALAEALKNAAAGLRATPAPPS